MKEQWYTFAKTAAIGGKYKSFMLCPKCSKTIQDDAKFCAYCGKDLLKSPKKRKRANGEGSVYKRGEKWCVEKRIMSNGADYRYRKGGFVREKDAKEHLDGLKNQSIKFKTMRYWDAYQIWIKSEKYNKLSKDKVCAYGTAWRRLEPIWYKDMRETPVSELQDIINLFPPTFYPRRDGVVVLSHLYKVALKDDAVDKNRAELLELPETPKSTRKCYTKDEVKAIWHDYYSGYVVGGYILIMIFMGLRTGELFDIDPVKVDLKKRCAIGGIKTEAGKNRDLPIPDIIIPVFERLLPSAKYGLVSVCLDKFYEMYGELKQRTGVKSDPYSARHTTATALAESGVAPAIIKEIMGHEKYETTLGYTHIPVEKKIKAINKAAKSNELKTKKSAEK